MGCGKFHLLMSRRLAYSVDVNLMVGRNVGRGRIYFQGCIARLPVGLEHSDDTILLLLFLFLLVVHLPARSHRLTRWADR